VKGPLSTRSDVRRPTPAGGERIAVQPAIDALEPRMRRVYIDHELRGYTMEESGGFQRAPALAQYV
jgi:hypothetical protein